MYDFRDQDVGPIRSVLLISKKHKSSRHVRGLGFVLRRLGFGWFADSRQSRVLAFIWID